MKEAIEKALKGGWSPRLECGELVLPILNSVNNGGFMAVIKEPHTFGLLDKSYPISKYRILHDKKFWQALGKQQGWSSEGCCRCSFGLGGKCFVEVMWKSVWHSFIDHIADGGDIEEFFKNLLK